MNALHQAALAELTAAPLALDATYPLGPLVASLQSGSFEVARRPNVPARVTSGIGLLPPLDGLLLYWSDFLGTSTRAWTESLKELGKNPEAKRLLGIVNTPGGSIFGLDEAFRAVRKVAKTKPVVLVAMPLMASAGYHIGSAATRILSLRSGSIGSIGTRATHVDLSEAYKKAGVRFTHITSDKRKVELEDDAPLSKDAKAFAQGELDKHFQLFLRNVAAGRGVTLAEARKWATGRVYQAADALQMGLIDGLVDSVQGAVNTTAATLTLGQRESKVRRAELTESVGGPAAMAALEAEWAEDKARAQREAAARKAELVAMEAAMAKYN